MSTSPYLFAPLALLCLGASLLARARDSQTNLGISLVIVDSCDIYSPREKQRPDAGDARVACITGTPYELSLSHPTRSADVVVPGETAHAVTTSAAENSLAVPEPSQRELHDARDVSITTVIF